MRLDNRNLRFTKFTFNKFIQCAWFKPLRLSVVISQVQALAFKTSTKWLPKCHLAIVGGSQSFLVSCWVGESHLVMNIKTCLAMSGVCFVFNVIAPPKSRYGFLTFVDWFVQTWTLWSSNSDDAQLGPWNLDVRADH